MNVTGKQALAVGLTAAAAVSLAVATVANAIHPRPKAASPISASLVPAYAECTSPDRTHGPPLAFPSCNPPAQESTSVTVGTPDANGVAANATGVTRLKSLPCSPGPPDDCEVDLLVNLTDVRCLPGTATCGPPMAGGADYTGELQHNATLRITDHFNAVPAGGGPDPATVIDIEFPVDVPCVATSSGAIGATCAVHTYLNAVVPAAVNDGKRAVWEYQQVRVTDGGPDGDTGTTPNALFAVQGIFIP
jgi:hypothetical protein